MNAVAADPDQRRRWLRAMGVTPYVLRDTADAARETVAVETSSAQSPRCVLVLPRDATQDTRQRALVEALLAALGLHEDAVHWLPADGEQLESEPLPAPAYLALGRTAARALGLALPAALREAARCIALVDDEPRQWLQSAAAKRAAWQALKPLRRALRGIEG
jgi:hypothetical protein